jgi:ankyrin repeat protein
VDEPDGSGWTPLHIAGKYDHSNGSRLTLNTWGILASAGREDIVRYLVGADANVNAKNDKGLTPL